MMKAKIKLMMVALLGVGFSGILLAGISAHAELPIKNKVTISIAKWDSEPSIKR